ncbi:MAG: hypothetical protein DMF00_07510 [Verrucomicrobia bacterium]|nr:MAG: hypothetical protein DMF00_07510 [Verrucomicrobiota bacterium]
MKRFILIVSASLLAFPLFGQEKSPQLKDQKDKVSYSIGMNIGANLSRQKVDINPDVLAAGIKDAIAGKTQLTQDQVKDVMQQFEKDMEQKQKTAGEKNKTDGVKFLEENKKKEGVKTTASGLEYKVLKEGTGPQPKATDMVTVNYRGTLIDGTEFDSSYKRGQPATFPLNGVIFSKWNCWTLNRLRRLPRKLQDLRHRVHRKVHRRRPSRRRNNHSGLMFQGTTAREAVTPSGPLPILSGGHRPIDLPGCRRRACPDEKCAQPLAGNRGPSIGWQEIRRSLRVGVSGPRASAFRFRLRSLSAEARTCRSRSQKNP